MHKAVQSTVEAIQTRLDNLEGALTLQGNDGSTRSLMQSFVDLETWALPLLNRPSITVETVEMLIDAKIKTAIMGVQSGERPSFESGGTKPSRKEHFHGRHLSN